MGLSCSRCEQLAHNADVSSPTGIQCVMNMLGKSCNGFDGNFQTTPNVPSYRREGGRVICTYTSTDSTKVHFRCSKTNAYRLCYCSGILKSFWDQIVCFESFSHYSSFFIETTTNMMATTTATLEDGFSYLGCYKDGGAVGRMWNDGNQGGSNQNSPRRSVQTDNRSPQVLN